MIAECPTPELAGLAESMKFVGWNDAAQGAMKRLQEFTGKENKWGK